MQNEEIYLLRNKSKAKKKCEGFTYKRYFYIEECIKLKDDCPLHEYYILRRKPKNASIIFISMKLLLLIMN